MQLFHYGKRNSSSNALTVHAWPTAQNGQKNAPARATAAPVLKTTNRNHNPQEAQSQQPCRLASHCLVPYQPYTVSGNPWGKAKPSDCATQAPSPTRAHLQQQQGRITEPAMQSCSHLQCMYCITHKRHSTAPAVQLLSGQTPAPARLQRCPAADAQWAYPGGPSAGTALPAAWPHVTR
jgi:hypothetical protein